MPSYRLSPEAKKDLLAIRAYTRNKWGRQQAWSFNESIEPTRIKVD
jgi:plasmid stabilization system protein ParE